MIKTPSKIYKIFSAANNIRLWGISETTKHLMRMSIEFFGVDDKRGVERHRPAGPAEDKPFANFEACRRRREI